MLNFNDSRIADLRSIMAVPMDTVTALVLAEVDTFKRCEPAALKREVACCSGSSIIKTASLNKLTMIKLQRLVVELEECKSNLWESTELEADLRTASTTRSGPVSWHACRAL